MCFGVDPLGRGIARPAKAKGVGEAIVVAKKRLGHAQQWAQACFDRPAEPNPEERFCLFDRNPVVKKAEGAFDVPGFDEGVVKLHKRVKTRNLLLGEVTAVFEPKMAGVLEDVRTLRGADNGATDFVDGLAEQCHGRELVHDLARVRQNLGDRFGVGRGEIH